MPFGPGMKTLRAPQVPGIFVLCWNDSQNPNLRALKQVLPEKFRPLKSIVPSAVKLLRMNQQLWKGIITTTRALSARIASDSLRYAPMHL